MEEINSLLYTGKVDTNYGGGPILTWEDKRFEEWGQSILYINY
jgi:hypothetical protein